MSQFNTSAAVCKVDEGLGLVFGWAIVCLEKGERHFDLQDDHIPEASMLEAATAYMDGERAAKDMHQGPEVGKVVFAWPLTTDIAKAFGLETDRTGLMIAMRPPSDILAKFKSGEYTGFSIGGIRVRDEEVEDA